MKTVIVSALAALLVVIGASPVVAQQPTDAEINEYIERNRVPPDLIHTSVRDL